MHPKNYFREVIGIFGAFLTFWISGIASLPIVAVIWPMSETADLPLKPQHFPSMILGFLLALYAFRRITQPRTQA